MTDQGQGNSGITIFAFVIQTGSGLRNHGQAIKASPEKWNKFFRERTGLREANVVLFDTNDWKPPQIKSLDEVMKNMPTIREETQNALKSCGVPSTALERVMSNVQGSPNPTTGQFLFWIVYKGELTSSKKEINRLHCGVCGSTIQHIFSDPIAEQILREYIIRDYSGEGSPEEYTRMMKSLGGICPNCGEVSCANCYNKNGHKCTKCEGKIPELAG